MAGGVLMGTVTDQAGSPLANRGVAAYRYDPLYERWVSVAGARTDANGSYAIVRLEAGDYRVYFTYGFQPESYAPEWYPDTPDPDQAVTLTLGEGQTIAQIDAALAPAGFIQGVVTGQDGDPLEGVEVWVYPSEVIPDPVRYSYYPTTYTDASGHYTFTGLPAGQHRVQFVPFNGSDYAPEWYEDAPEWHSAAEVAVELGQATGNIDAALAVGGQIAGTVTDESGQPMSEIQVEALLYDPESDLWWYTGIHSVTAADGRYRLSGLKTGTYRLRFSPWFNEDSDYAVEWYDDVPTEDSGVNLSVQHGQTLNNIDAALSIGGRISGQITTDGGREGRSGLFAGDSER